MNVVRQRAVAAAFFALGCAPLAHAQWTASGTHIYNSNTGHVGIGTNLINGLLTVGTKPVFEVFSGGLPGGSQGVTIDFGGVYNGTTLGQTAMIQSERQGYYYTPIDLNPLGGQVVIGRMTQGAANYPDVDNNGSTAYSRFAVFQNVAFGSVVMADHVLDTSSGPGTDSGAGRYVARQLYSGQTSIRALEAQTLRGAGASPTYTWGLEVGLHSQVPGDGSENIGIFCASSHTGWLSSGVRNDVGMMVTGEDGWKYGFAYFDTDYVTRLFSVDQYGNLYTRGSVAQGSSRLLKQHIQSLDTDSAVDDVMKLKPVRFEYKADPATEHYGFIAEDTPVPLATKDHKAVNLSEMVAVLTATVQRQQEVIDRLASRVGELEKK